jgi:hypothetical protein
MLSPGWDNASILNNDGQGSKRRWYWLYLQEAIEDALHHRCRCDALRVVLPILENASEEA